MATFTIEDAQNIGEDIGIDWDAVDFSPESFLAGLEVELEHGTERGEEVNVTDDDPNLTGMIAWAHLMEDPDYYELLAEMEARFDVVKTEEVDPGMDRAEGATFRQSSLMYDNRVYAKRRNEGSLLETGKRRKFAYELSEIASGGLKELSPEIHILAKAFVKQAENYAESLSPREEDPDEFLEYFVDAVQSTPSLHKISSGDLVDLLLDNPSIGAIPLMQLKAADLVRGDDIDVYDYLQAAVEAAVSTAAQEIAKEMMPKRQTRDTRTREEMESDPGEDTAVSSPGAKRKQQEQQQASVRIGSSIYRKVAK